MKTPPKFRWVCAALALVFLLVGGGILTDKTPSYSELKASCDDALSKSSRSEALGTWLKSNHIPSKRVSGPLEESFKHILVSNGISSTAANRAAKCIYFEVGVRGGFLSRHVAYGYFVFTEDDSLIDYNIHDIHYGM